MASQPGPVSRFIRRQVRALWSAGMSKVDEKVAAGIGRVHQLGRDIRHGGRFTCSCGARTCPGRFRSLRLWKTHHLARNAGRWTSKRARAAGRAMGKDVDAMRRHARSFLEVAGLRDARGQHTDRSRSRPQVSGRLARRDLRGLHRHDRDHERAIKRDHRADRAERKGRTDRAAAHRERAESLRARHPVRTPAPGPARVPVPVPVGAREPAHAGGNGTRPAPERSPRNGSGPARERTR